MAQNDFRSDFKVDMGRVYYNGQSPDLIIPEGLVSVLEQYSLAYGPIRSLVIPEGIHTLKKECISQGYGLIRTLVLPNSLKCIEKGAIKSSQVFDWHIKTDIVCNSWQKETLLNNWLDGHSDEEYKRWRPLFLDRINWIESGSDEAKEILARVSSSSEQRVDTSKFHIKCGRLVEYNGVDAELIIPCYVSSIAEGYRPENDTSFGGGYGDAALGVFENSSICDVTFSSGLDYIGEYAFAGCKSLKTVFLPEGIRMIGSFAFLDCSSLTKIVIPITCTEIGTRSFEGCSSLRRVSFIDKPHDWLEESSSVAVRPKRWRCIGKGYTQTAVVDEVYLSVNPFSTTEETQRVDGGSYLLPYPDVPNKHHLYIKEGAFRKCTSLEEVVFPSMFYLYDFCFDGCGELSNLVFQGHIKKKNDYDSIPEGCFRDCRSIESLDLRNIVNCDELRLEKECFKGMSSLVQVKFPKGLKKLTIEEEAFYGCKRLRELRLSKDIEIRIEKNAFGECDTMNSNVFSEENIERNRWGLESAPFYEDCVKQIIKKRVHLDEIEDLDKKIDEYYIEIWTLNARYQNAGVFALGEKRDIAREREFYISKKNALIKKADNLRRGLREKLREECRHYDIDFEHAFGERYNLSQAEMLDKRRTSELF